MRVTLSRDRKGLSIEADAGAPLEDINLNTLADGLRAAAEAALPILRPDDPIVVKRRDVERITNTLCSCGGRGPDNGPCDACAIYHELLRLGDAKQCLPVPDGARCGDCVFWHELTMGQMATASPICACIDSHEYLKHTTEAQCCVSFRPRSKSEGDSDESTVGKSKDA